MLHAEIQVGPWHARCLPVALELRAGSVAQQIASIALELREDSQTASAENQALAHLRLAGPFDPEAFPLLIRAELCLPASTDTFALRYPSQAQLRQAILRASSDYWLTARIQTSDGQEHVIQQAIAGF